MKNYYHILGVDESASLVEINDAFRKLARKFHPDKNENDPFFAACFKEINEAKQVLTDDLERAVFDLQLSEYVEAFELHKQKQEAHLNKRLRWEQLYSTATSTNGKRWWIGGVIAIAAILLAVFLTPTQSGDVNEAEPPFMLAHTDEKASLPAEDDLKDKVDKALNTESQVTQVKETMAYSGAEKLQAKSQNKKPPIENAALPTEDVEQDVTEIDTRSVSEAEAKDIIQRLRQEKDIFCVRLLQSNSSNIKSDFSLAADLQKNGFVISGRGVTDIEVQGIQIERMGNCLQLIIGTL